MNPFKMVKGLAAGAKLLGRAQAKVEAATADTDGDGTPEWKEAVNGAANLAKRIKEVSIPRLLAIKDEIGSEVKVLASIVNEQIVPNIASVIEAARAAGKAEGEKEEAEKNGS